MVGSIEGQRITHIWDSVEDCYGRSWQLCDTRLEARDSEIEKSGKPTCKRCLKECAKTMKFYTDMLKELGEL